MLIHHDQKYSLEDVLAVVLGEEVELAPETKQMLAERRAQIEAFVTGDKPYYGFNRGFGHNVDQAVEVELIEELQENLIRSHACGVGEYAPKEVIRATMFLRAVSLSRGHSGVRPLIVEKLIEMLNKGVTPCVPRHGSVGASGDLAPLSHIAMVLIEPGGGDEEFAWIPGVEGAIPAGEAMAAVGISRIKLEAKEGLAFNNGTTYSTALGVLSTLLGERLLKTASIATAMSAQVLLGADTPYRADLHDLRPHPGAKTVARWLTAMMADSPIRNAHKDHEDDGEVQDPYSIRCAGQILGACHDQLSFARKTLETELASVTDNPLILKMTAADAVDQGVDSRWVGQYVNIVSGGHFHGMPVAFAMFGVMQAVAVMARLSNMRCARYVDGRRNKGMNEDLKWFDEWQDRPLDAISSGMMIPEYVTASLTNVIWGASMPSHLMSISTDAGQEDHVSMSAGLGVRLWETLPRLAEILAIELAFTNQAAAIRARSGALPSKIALDVEANEQVAELKRKLEAKAQELLNENLQNERFEVSCGLAVSHLIDEDGLRLSPCCEALKERISSIFPPVTVDRYMSRQIRQLAELVMSGDIVKTVETALGRGLGRV